jgi:hypothetical protein
MTVENFAKDYGFTAICMPSPQKEINGAYSGDLLSWVMGRAEIGNVWITIMSNINILAVATLADVSCILLCEGVTLETDVLSVAAEKGVNILSTDLTAYNAAAKICKSI